MTKLLFSILRQNLSKFVTQTGLYCSKQLETTHQFCEKALHISFKLRALNEFVVTFTSPLFIMPSAFFTYFLVYKGIKKDIACSV